MAVCPKCGSKIDETLGICTLCGGDAKPVILQQTIEKATTKCSNCGYPLVSKATKCPQCNKGVCSYCGNILSPDIKKCPKCGHKILPSIKLTLAVTIGVLLLIGSCTVCITNMTNNTNAPVKTSPKTSAPASRPLPATFNPITLRGTDSETTPPFTVTTKEWIIDWSYSTDDPDFAIFSFFVYPRGETASYAESVLFPKVTSGTTYSYAGPGEYYIKTAAGNITQWEITIRPAE